MKPTVDARAVPIPVVRTTIYCILVSLLFASVGTHPAMAQEEKPKMLVLDYAMGYPEENAGVIGVFSEAGYEVHYRQYYPALVGTDASTYDAITLLGGGDPGMSRQETDLAINFVSRGKLLILAIPPDSELGGRRRTNAGIHDRYMFNRILTRLNISMYAYAPPVSKSVVMTPALTFDPLASLDRLGGPRESLIMRADTRVLVGDGVLPVFLEPEAGEPDALEEEQVAAEEQEIKMVERRIRVQPPDAIVDEEIDLLLRGENTLRPALHYKSGREPVLVEWKTREVKGRVVEATGDTVTVRMPGNRWGSDNAVVAVPVGVAAVAFVKREMPEEFRAVDGGEEIAASETGRMAVMAVGRGDRLDKGFVAVVDRRFLNTLSVADAPISQPRSGLPNREQAGPALVRSAQFLRSLAEKPTIWNPDNPHDRAVVPGLSEPDFPVNTLEILPSLPERVNVLTHKHSVPDGTSYKPTSSLKGAWEYVLRADARIDTLLDHLSTQSFDLFWTVTPGAGLSSPDSTLTEEMRLSRWGRNIATGLSGSGVTWLAGVTPHDKMEGGYGSSVDARGNKVELPVLLDPGYLKDELLAPSLALARFSRTNKVLKGIVHDWETHINRFHTPHAVTDAFDDDSFRQFVRYLARNGWYGGKEFDSYKDAGRDRRFEWVLKSGRLEMYLQFVEDRASDIGRMYREALDEANPALSHGGFMRTPRLSWYYLGFLKGLNNPERPTLILFYERPKPWYLQFLIEKGLNVRFLPVALMGMIPAESFDDVLEEAEKEGGYMLERGLWLVTDPESPDDPGAPRR